MSLKRGSDFQFCKSDMKEICIWQRLNINDFHICLERETIIQPGRYASIYFWKVRFQGLPSRLDTDSSHIGRRITYEQIIRTSDSGRDLLLPRNESSYGFSSRKCCGSDRKLYGNIIPISEFPLESRVHIILKLGRSDPT